MLREITQIILSFAGLIAAFFVSPDSENFSFMQLGVALVLLIVAAVLLWCIPELFRRRGKS